MATSTIATNGRAAPPRENLYRAINPGGELRSSADGGTTLTGHFAVFDEWTHIDSVWEGEFMERIAPGAFAKTFREQTPKVLFQHGMDPQIGDKPLGPLEVLREDKIGGYYEVPLLDTSYNADLLPGLRAGLYGASFRFKVMREIIEEEPDVSDTNPHGLPERTIKEAKVMELGPVTFPAYQGATAGVRSITDEFVIARFARSPRQLAAALKFNTARFDNEDVSTLAQMIALGTEFIDDQDEPDETGNVTAMEGVLTTLAALLSGEAAETEPDEPEDENEGRSAPSNTDAAPTGTSEQERREATVKTWPHVPQEEWEHNIWNRTT